MRRRVLLALAFGVVGTAILVGLGVWQVQRLAWKEGLIAELEARLEAAPAPLPAAPEEARDEYLRVQVSGRTAETRTGGPWPGMRVLTSVRPWGPGYRIVAPFETEGGRRILVDWGFVPEAEARTGWPDPAPGRAATVTGALLWPNETDSFTPDPDLAANLWFARDAVRMAAAEGAEPFLLVAETPAPGADRWPHPEPLTIDLPNDHLQYAITWFSLAAIWAVMTVFLIRRERRRAD